jgi:hypothetical protein
MLARSCVMWFAGSTVGISSSPYTSSATGTCRFALNDVRMPRRTRGSHSVHCWSAWHMMTAFSVQWKRSTSPLAAGWWVVVQKSYIPHNLAREWKSCVKN